MNTETAGTNAHCNPLKLRKTMFFDNFKVFIPFYKKVH